MCQSVAIWNQYLLDYDLPQPTAPSLESLDFLEESVDSGLVSNDQLKTDESDAKCNKPNFCIGIAFMLFFGIMFLFAHAEHQRRNSRSRYNSRSSYHHWD